jgi:DcuC family C4-dicarboxylate transporter
MDNIAVLIILMSAIYAVIKGIDVRIVLLVSGILLCSIAGVPFKVLDEFQRVMGEGKIIGPICSAMGYAFILKATGCDRAMVQLIMKPIMKLKFLLIPGSCLVGFITNIAITSQTASAAAVGPIIIPILIATRFHPIIAGSALVLGCSLGGNLFNPGEPDIVGIQTATSAPIASVLDMAFLPEMIAFISAVSVFTVISYTFPPKSPWNNVFTLDSDSEKPHYLKAIMPPLPVITLLLVQPGALLAKPILDVYPNGLPVPHVMVTYSLLVMLLNWKQISSLTAEFFSGVGYGYTHVISLIITASCFIAGLDSVGILKNIVTLVSEVGFLSKIFSGIATFSMALLSGSGTAPSVAFSQSVLPSIQMIDKIAAIDLGIIGAIGATLGRTMSPAAAVIIYASTIIGFSPIDIVKRTSIPVIIAMIMVLVFFIVK